MPPTSIPNEVFLDAVDAVVLEALGRIGDDPEARFAVDHLARERARIGLSRFGEEVLTVQNRLDVVVTRADVLVPHAVVMHRRALAQRLQDRIRTLPETFSDCREFDALRQRRLVIGVVHGLPPCSISLVAGECMNCPTGIVATGDGSLPRMTLTAVANVGALGVSIDGGSSEHPKGLAAHFQHGKSVTSTQPQEMKRRTLMPRHRILPDPRAAGRMIELLV